MNCNFVKNSNQQNREHTTTPIYVPNTIMDDEIKQRTGFVSKTAMLAHIVLFCNEDIDRVSETNSPLTSHVVQGVDGSI